ncbi:MULTISPECIES: DNA polymerase III subunit beta [Paraclostridium]|uniref:Beta sliding clamp n=3 Tax=Paraclostridium TaxID=1849822 RepID=A0A0M3DL73_9FIRM|nr:MULTISPECIES: DNA polymerase III subunit beta [Paraclostridium]MCU9807573.1 DNA polymerase III subunit beta [Paraclostridium sp. AKS46]MDV8113961.1 DNA polymerase III subunit beta [Bacillus sp. BAU-SS-2023]EQK49595.1 DNA polymerase III, beta subunit [[Clostridium] bifermentans ATCC 19299] [Paraclostridium bifermentans ATCC 19299]KKY02132.1 DNA polymerase III subunit beta [Paraclostridium benzoelyticum]MBN8048706.1 DNA polymerase III subunit beta [Paraclostridium bifermentans]
MKIICNQKILAHKISIVQKAINGKTTLELLKGILLTAKEGTLNLTGYDLEIGIDTHIQAEIVEEGEIVINARLFGDIIRKLPDTFVEIETDSDNNVYINCLNSRFKIKGDSAVEYPRLPDVNENDLYNIPQDLLKNMIKQTVFAISQDQTKPILMGELLEIVGGNISLVAIDGYRLAVRSSEIDNMSNNTKVIIPGKTLHDVNGLLSSEDDAIQLGFDEKNAIFIINETKIITRLLDGEFIDYKKLLPREYGVRAKVNTKELLNSIERASLLSQSEKNNLIKLSIRDNSIAITSNTEKGNVYEEVSIELEGDYLDIAFNSRYFLDALKVIDSEEIFIEFTTNVNPCIIKPVDGTKYTYLLLPVRISSNI